MRTNVKSSNFLLQIFKGLVIALLITLISVLVFAFILSALDLSDKVIRPVNQTIKTVSILLGVVFSVKEGKFLIKGGLIGLLSTLFSVLLFTLLAGASASWLTVFIDLIFGLLIGFLSGLLIGKVRAW